MHELHLGLAAFFRPALDALEESGLPSDRLLRQSGLNIYDLYCPEAYIPVRNMYVVLDRMSRELGAERFSALLWEKARLANVDCRKGAVAFSPDLLAAVKYVEKYVKYLSSNVRLELVIDGLVSTIRLLFVDEPTRGRLKTELLSFGVLYDYVDAAGCSAWSPLAVQLQNPEIPGFEALFSFANKTTVQFNQPYTSLSFATSMLSAPMRCDAGKLVFGQKVLPPFDTLSERLRCLMDATNCGRLLDLAAASDAVGVSARTLKRYLRAEGTGYSELVDQWRLKKALKLLENSSLSVSEIADVLHYANTSNFIRAFTRWTGQSPMDYRGGCFIISSHGLIRPAGVVSLF